MQRKTREIKVLFRKALLGALVTTALEFLAFLCGLATSARERVENHLSPARWLAQGAKSTKEKLKNQNLTPSRF